MLPPSCFRFVSLDRKPHPFFSYIRSIIAKQFHLCFVWPETFLQKRKKRLFSFMTKGHSYSWDSPSGGCTDSPHTFTSSFVVLGFSSIFWTKVDLFPGSTFLPPFLMIQCPCGPKIFILHTDVSTDAFGILILMAIAFNKVPRIIPWH